jgi:hypothetical protein
VPALLAARDAHLAAAAEAGSDEGLLSFCLPHSRLYGESLQLQEMPVANDSVPSYILAGRAGGAAGSGGCAGNSRGKREGP